jgi:hypothetical protein
MVALEIDGKKPLDESGRAGFWSRWRPGFPAAPGGTVCSQIDPLQSLLLDKLHAHQVGAETARTGGSFSREEMMRDHE